jgi:acetylornithine deacetylase/succinyl-diaminopimelate desuccinylase-like protein
MTDIARASRFVDQLWDADVVPTLVEYVKIPAKSPAFDANWASNGHLETATALYEGWARKSLADVPGATVDVIRLEGRTPVIFIDIPGEASGNILMYGHLDKQPEMTGWSEGMGPWTPVIRDDKLYGRGSADDGYAMFGAITAVLALREQGLPHARTAILIEACEESGSFDLPAYIDHLRPRIGEPDLFVVLDSGCGNYDQLWVTTSLRGMVGGTLTVEVLREGVHSGDASGVVPSSFRILRQLLSRLEDAETGRILVDECWIDIPEQRVEQAHRAAAALGDEVWSKFPWVEGMQPVEKDGGELVLNRTWRPQLAMTGIDGAPSIANAGNVLRPGTALKLSLRLPPALDAERAAARVKEVLEADPPYGAKVSFEVKDASTGWNAKPLAPWLETSLDRAGRAAFGAEPAFMGEGGSIPLITMLGEMFPTAQFVVTGVLGPHSNAHGPDEFLHLPTVKKVCTVIAAVLGDHAAQGAGRLAA